MPLERTLTIVVRPRVRRVWVYLTLGGWLDVYLDGNLIASARGSSASRYFPVEVTPGSHTIEVRAAPSGGSFHVAVYDENHRALLSWTDDVGWFGSKSRTFTVS